MKFIVKGLLILVSLLVFQNSNAQINKYIIYFSDKDGVEINPYDFLDSKAIERRIIHEIPLLDYSDLPVRKDYIESIEKLSEKSLYASRWFNAIISLNTPEQIQKIEKLLFVTSIEKLDYFESNISEFNEKEAEDNFENIALLINQTKTLGENYFKEKNITGKGIRIAIFDAGFKGVDTNPAFEHIRKENRILKTYDFVRKKDFVYSYSQHGTAVLSCVGGIYKNYNIGLATDAEFLLARTEKTISEPFSEEENWLAAAEWADINGAQIINSSLGYTHHRYFKSDMDGKKSFVTRAANMAAKKGMLVINSAGNSGSDKWKIMGAPADADSVLSIGGVSPNKNYHTSFSSFGPTADKRLKPNVTAYGHVYAASPSAMAKTQGTSFSSPLVAGFAACALQTRPNLKNMELFREIEKSGHLYPYFDYAHGYGIPQAKYFFLYNTAVAEPPAATFKIETTNDSLKIIIAESVFEQNKLNAEKDNFTDTDYLYFHIENTKGYLRYYAVLKVTEQELTHEELNSLRKGETLRVFYKGRMTEKKFN
jgi:serine protease AprX